MNKRLITTILLAPVFMAALPASGGDFLQPPMSGTTNRWGLDFRMAFNVGVDFKTEFGPDASLPGPGVSGVDRNYDDGFNRVDNNGNVDGITHYWGYEHDSQYDAANHAITMHSASGSTAASDRGDKLMMGFELTYNRELGRKGKTRWGVESAINYMKVAVHDDQPSSVRGTLLADTYQLPELPFGGGYVIPPPAPYSGTYEAPGSGSPTLSDNPSARATSALSSTSSGTREFDANVIGWRIGPFLEFPVATNLSFSLSGGFSLVGVISDYRFHETVTYNDPGSAFDNLEVLVRGSGLNAGLLAGGYVGGGFSVVLEKGWTAYGGAQFQYAGTYTHREGVSSAKLDLGKSLFVSLGASYSF